jgi:hypothetical protein
VRAENVIDPRSDPLRSILKSLPSDFEPWGARSRENDCGPDCSCGRRWFVPLEGMLRYDWGVCYNPASPRAGLLTFERQGCREFEESDEELDYEDLFRPVSGERSAEVELLRRLRIFRTDIEELLSKSSDHWGYEDPVYRFYHQSFKVYRLQEHTKAIVEQLRKLSPGRELNSWFLGIVEAGRGKEFKLEDNRNWTATTRPILEAFFHARFFLEMASRYHSLDKPPRLLPSGYAALLYLYRLR